MKLHRLCTSLFFPCFLIASVLLPFVVVEYSRGADVAPEHDIVILESSAVPAWKILWDQAREHARQKQFRLAAAEYDELIRTKSQIEEAKWEYCKVLVELNDWLTASDLLESLLETDSDRSEYLQLAATVALKNREFKRAVDYFGEVYGSDPGGPYSIEALKGLIAGLQGLGRKNLAFPLMEQLYLRTPQDHQLLQNLAGYAHEIGDLPKARAYYSALVGRSKADDQILLKASTLFEVPGAEKEALAIWEKYLEKQPAYLPFHKKIADYYMLIGKSQSALPHILYMIDNGVEDDDLLLVAGRIYLEDEGRPDKALRYYEEYAEEHPEDIAIQAEIKKTQTLLANDFLSIVENDGASMLWRDLEQVTPNRLAIYREMAAQFTKLGKTKELLSVLLIINRHHPEDENNIFRIAEIFLKQKKYIDALSFLKEIKGPSSKSYDYMLMRAKVEERLGGEMDALQLYTACLRIKPDNHALRLRSIRLAGRLGLIERMKAIYEGSAGNLEGEEGVALGIQYIEGLRANALFRQAEDLYVELLSHTRTVPEREVKILLHKADTLGVAGQFFQAEQVLREILARNIAIEKVLSRLVRLALINDDLPRARGWFALLLEKTGRHDWRLCADRLGRDIFRLHIAILLAEDAHDTVVHDVETALKKLGALDQEKDVRSMTLEMQIILCRALLKQEKYDQCLRLLTDLREKQPKNLELALLWFQLSKKKGKSATAYAEIDQLLQVSGRPILSRTLEAVALELENGELAAGLHHLAMIRNEIPDSVAARLLKAKLLAAQGNLQEALQGYRGLIGSVGEQTFLSQQVLELEFKLGNYGKVVKQSETVVSPTVTVPAGTVSRSSKVTRDYWRKLLLARALWVDKQWDAALKVYEMLLLDPVQEEFLTAIAQENIEVFMPPLKKSIWNMLSFTSPEVRDPLALYMEPEFVGRHLGQPIDKITARMYEKYRWQKLIRNEYLAKKAVLSKDIHSAEKQYSQLIREDKNIEGLYDLARIYGRLGEYGKEAELYQVIRKIGPMYPDLKKSIQRNELRRRPRLSADFDVVEKKGREGSIDILRKGQGAAVWFMPGLDSEASVEYKRNTYSSSGDEEILRGHKLVGSYSLDVDRDTEIFLRLGGENIDRYDTTALAGVEISRGLDDVLKGYLAFDQDTVNDTLSATKSGLYSQDFEVGLIADPQGGSVLGGDYRRRRYSDDNSQNQFHLWSAYNIYNESNTFKFQYNYKLVQNSEANLPDAGEISMVGPAEDLSYWSPDDYWEHLATISYERLLKTFSLLRETPSYYAIDYSVGYESSQNIVYKAGFEIFLEMSRHFLLKGNLTYSTSEEYDQKGALISLIYRW